MSDTLTTDVLVVGSSPARGGAALATLGFDHIVVTKYRWTANTPRAHLTNRRMMEIFRDLGIEDDVLAQSTPQHLLGDMVFCTSLAGEHPVREADYTLASPSFNCDIPADGPGADRDRACCVVG